MIGFITEMECVCCVVQVESLIQFRSIFIFEEFSQLSLSPIMTAYLEAVKHSSTVDTPPCNLES
jgi:hypothetical protein